MAQNTDVGMKCIKYMLFVSNIMFVMVGVLLISFGSTIKSIYSDFSWFMEDNYFSPAKLTIAIGVIIFMISAFGCAAAIKESTAMVNIYALLLAIVLIMEVSVSIAAYSMRDSIHSYLEGKMHNALLRYNTDASAKHSFDFMQDQLGCCGIYSEKDWDSIKTAYPKSCYITFYISPVRNNTEISPYGCLNRLEYIVNESSMMLGTGALCIAFVQLLGIIFAVLLAKSIRRLKTERAAQRWQTRQELYLKLARGSEKPVAETPVTYVSDHTATSSDA